MDELGCDYECKTVSESIAKYSIPDDWCAEFDFFDCIHSVICIQVGQVRKDPAIMDLKLRIVENEDYEYAGCIMLPDRKTIVFKVDRLRDFVRKKQSKDR